MQTTGTSRRPARERIGILTSNAGKFREISADLKKAGVDCEQVSLPHPEIQSDSLEDVVVFKAEWAARARPGLSIVADDSGLFIRALKGFPGVYSSHAYKTLGCEGMLRLLAGEKDRGAHFECCICYMPAGSSGRQHLVFKGISPGKISAQMYGGGGFGFDPIFIPDGQKRTFAQMGMGEKNALSHRGKAVAGLVRHLYRKCARR